MIRPNLNGYVSYASVPAARRHDQAQRARLQSESDYSPATDFWKPVRTAIRWDRTTTRNGAQLREVAERAISKRQPSYQVVADAWPEISERWLQGMPIKSPAKEIVVGGLAVAVRPLFSELMIDGTIEHVMVWMNLARPTEAAVHGALRLLTLLDDAPNVRAVFVDVRRRQILTGTAATLRDEDAELVATCASFLRDAA